MLDIKLIRDNPNVVRANLRKREDKQKENLMDELLDKDRKWRQVLQDVDKMKQQRNIFSRKVAELKSRNEDASKVLKEAALIPAKIKELEAEAEMLKNRSNWILMRLPNLLHDYVPLGKDEHDNVEIKKWGKPPKFNFEPKSHTDLVGHLMEEERAAKVAGRGFFYLKNKLAILDLALQRYALDFLMKKRFTVMIPPYLMRREPYEGVTDLADFDNVLYKVEGEDLHLIATSEHPMAAMYKDEIINKDDLPLKFAGLSPCFRKEVGAHGKYTKGFFRMHHFHKVEQFVFSTPEKSWDLHEELQKNVDAILKNLGIYFRIVNVCTGDIGTVAAKKYDTEFWMADNAFREIGSNSNCTDYQARRLNIKYREKEGQLPVGFVHTLNSTAIATSRVMIAIIEQNQQKDGSVKIPKALWKYCGFKEIEPFR